jgi:hypothetical protein
MDRRDEILQRLLLEEADPLAALARSELAGDVNARAELEELLDAERRVRALAAEEREARRPSAPGSAERAAEERVLERLRSHLAAQSAEFKGLLDVERRVQALAADERAALQPSAPGSPERLAEERVLERLREHVGVQPPARRKRNPLANLVLLLAAALALFLGWRWLAGGEPEPDPDTKLGSQVRTEVQIEIQEPVRWSGDIAWTINRMPANAHFVVHVLDGTPGSTGDKVDASPPLQQNHWSPTEAEWTSWPDEIRIYVELRDPGSNVPPERSPEVRARRSP